MKEIKVLTFEVDKNTGLFRQKEKSVIEKEQRMNFIFRESDDGGTTVEVFPVLSFCDQKEMFLIMFFGMNNDSHNNP